MNGVGETEPGASGAGVSVPPPAGDDREVERWLRGVGLPSFVRAGAAGEQLVSRVTPFVVYLVAAAVLALLTPLIDLDFDTDSDALALLFLAALVLGAAATIALPILLAVASARILRRRPPAALPTGIVALALYLVVLPVVGAIVDDSATALWRAALHLAIVLVAVALTWLGVGSLLAWTGRAAVQQLSAVGALVTRALPILMLVIVFAFFSRPVWEVTSTMSVARLFAVAVFFAVLGLLFVLPIGRTEMRELDETIAPGDRIRSVRSAGLEALSAYATEPGPPLRRLERANLWAVLVVSLALQTLVFAVIVWVVLMLLGGLAFSREVLEEWVGGRLTEIELFGVEVPFTWALVKTAVFLSCVSSLNFLVSVVTNAGYRTAFFHPLIDGARSALAVRGAYRRRRAGAAPASEGAVADALARADADAAARSHPAASSAARHDHDSDTDSELPMIEPGPGSAG
ncbi:hypothetical protein N1031_10115 [Herbiconiux moechotypicola]|uniref:Integral membrane protein n=1 Tax=Herbiconiux moechotypicola TaxID=637393 RepID=A0ABP5QK72_9MICO|nr:hypothetical protein [Herbiconiux moechotypicola]MCS5730116.1 hypothetical protein [Herbiconiux moechotypicola]